MSNTKRQRHVALLVEDDPDMAAEMIELLRLFGHDCVHASTKAEAEPLIEQGNFCFALLDLEIKADADSIKARVEAGEQVLELLRQTYPRRNGNDHLLQVLMVSGHSQPRYIVSALQHEANDFVPKPIGECSPPFKTKLEDALRRSGRQRHEDCAEITHRARNGSSPSEATACLTVTAVQRGTRYEVKLDGTSIFLTLGSFVVLVKLVAARLRDRESWVHKTALGSKDEQGWKGMTRLKKELAESGATSIDMIENDKAGDYRLHSDVELGPIDLQRLSSIEDARMRQLVKEISAIQTSH